MFVLILLILLALVGIAAAIFPVHYVSERDGEPKKTRALAGVAGGLIFLIFLLFGWTTVPPKNVGVVQTLGAVSDRTLDSGFALKWPWQKVTDIDATIQTDRYHGDSCIKVQLGDGSNSCISLTNSYRINSERANEVFEDYRSDNPTEQFRDAVVSTQLIASSVVVARTYNPIASLKVVDPGTAATPPSFGPDYEALAKAIKADLEERTKGLAEILSLNVTAVPLDDSTQAKINAFTAEVANTRTKQQEKLTKIAEAEGNKELAASLRNDPLLLISKCLDLVAEGKISTAGNFQCFGEGGATPVFPVGGNK
jgi:regulator of protease activity HflC (stomatin/prohibitin superfamily)